MKEILLTAISKAHTWLIDLILFMIVGTFSFMLYMFSRRTIKFKNRDGGGITIE